MSRSVPLDTNPLLDEKTPPWRSSLILIVLAACFIGLFVRAVYVQIVARDYYQREGEVRYARTLELPASRGRVLDRNGMLLASSVPAPSIWANPEDVERDPANLKQLASLLDMELSELEKKLSEKNQQGKDKTFVWLNRHMDEAQAKAVLAQGFKGVYSIKEYKRLYPEGEAAAHVVGQTTLENKGSEGIELEFQDQLAGKNGSRRVIKDRYGRVVEAVGETVPPEDGQDIQLSIDSKVQFFAYQKVREAVLEHKAKAGSAVVLDVQTGEVLALANYPSFSPEKRVARQSDQVLNRALTDVFEPGSTMKPFAVALALEKGLVKPETPIQTAPGRMTITGSTITDAHPHGMLSVNEVIQKSSNVGTVKLAMQMEPRELWEMYSAVGFGQKPNISFPKVASGRLRPYKSWRPIEQATMSYGYGISGSLLQMARAYTVFARDGDVVPATLLKTDHPVQGVRVVSPENARAMRKMLHMVTQSGGTAPKAQTVGYSVGGKTGTAHKQEGKGYAGNKYRGSFVGMAPIEQPRIVVAVMIDEPSNGRYYGGDVAAPVFSATVQQTLRLLNVQPDMTVKPQVKVQAVEESF